MTHRGPPARGGPSLPGDRGPQDPRDERRSGPAAARALVAHERRVVRRLEARGEDGLGDALVLLDGATFADRYRVESLYAVGSEGAVYLVRDLADAGAPLRVGKVPLHPLHRPFDLTDDGLAARRASLRAEGENLARAGSRYMPRSLGVFDVAQPALDPDWGGEFDAPEPILVMEKLPGFDLDLWLARMHSSHVPRSILRRQLDHVAVVVLTALMDLHDRGFFYTDLRPGNVRIRGRSRERVRLFDAGSLVALDDRSGKFPHVPAYLPPDLFDASREGHLLVPTTSVQAVMAGRTLFEVATGRVPVPGEAVDTSTLFGLNVSPSVAETIEGLCRGSFPDVRDALAYLSENFLEVKVHKSAREAGGPRASQTGAPPQPVSRRAPPQVVRPPAPAPAVAPAAADRAAASSGGRCSTPGPAPLPAAATTKRDLHSVLAQVRSLQATLKPVPRPGDPRVSQTGAAAERGAPAPEARPAPDVARAERGAPEVVLPVRPERTDVPAPAAPDESASETEAEEAVDAVLVEALASTLEAPAEDPPPVVHVGLEAPPPAAAPAPARRPARPWVQPAVPTSVPLAQAFALAPKPARSAHAAPSDARTATQRNAAALGSHESGTVEAEAADEVPVLEPVSQPVDDPGRARDDGAPVLPPPDTRRWLARFADWLFGAR